MYSFRVLLYLRKLSSEMRLFPNSGCSKFKGLRFPAQFRPKFSLSFRIEHPVKECAAGRHCCVHAALSFTLAIIHPPAPSTSQPPTASPGSILLPRIRRDGNLAESFAIYDGANAPPPRALTSVYTRAR